MFWQNSAVMLSCFEYLLFIWDRANLAMSHEICIPSSKMGEEKFNKKSIVADQKNFDFKEGKVG